jgi:hypothetical protein
MVDEESMKKINVGEMKGGLEVEQIVDSYNNELHSTYSAPLNIDGHLKFKCSNSREETGHMFISISSLDFFSKPIRRP